MALEELLQEQQRPRSHKSRSMATSKQRRKFPTRPKDQPLASWPELFVSWPRRSCLPGPQDPHPAIPSAPMIMSNMFYDIWR